METTEKQENLGERTIRVVTDGYEKILQFNTKMAQTAASAISLAYDGIYGQINQNKAKELLQESKQPITIAFTSQEDYKTFCEKANEYGVTNLHLQEADGTYLCICKSEQANLINRIIKKNDLSPIKEDDLEKSNEKVIDKVVDKAKNVMDEEKEKGGNEKNPTVPSWNEKNATQSKTESNSHNSSLNNLKENTAKTVMIDGKQVNLTQDKLNLIKESGLPEVGSKLTEGLGNSAIAGAKELGKGLKKAITEQKETVDDVINAVKKEMSEEANATDKTMETLEEAIKTIVKTATKAAGKSL